MRISRLVLGSLLAFVAFGCATTTDVGEGLDQDLTAHSTGMKGLKTVFVIVMENHDWSAIHGSASAPYINGTLLPQGSHAENYFNPAANHPSEPNYLWLEAGQSFGIKDDKTPSSNHQATHAHLSAQLDAANISWKSYQEDIDGTTCPLATKGLYAPKHNPFVFFDDETGNGSAKDPSCIAHNRPYTELGTDLQAGNVARYNFITPNLCNDMHNSSGCGSSDSVKNGDTWLATAVPQILASRAYKDGGVLFITWDESEHGDHPIGMIALSSKAKGKGFASTVHLTHSSLLRSVQEIFGVSPFLGDAASAIDLSDLFGSGGPPAPALDAGLVQGQYVLPNAQLTPGMVLTTDVSVISQPGYSSTVRHVTASEKSAVATEYSYTGPSSGVEYDHLISLELGGGNDITNLWPQPIAEAKVKDGLEDYLHAKVLEGKLPLAEVQKRIAADWVKLWNDVGQPGTSNPGATDPRLP